jgi:hypothetical protein
LPLPVRTQKEGQKEAKMAKTSCPKQPKSSKATSKIGSREPDFTKNRPKQTQIPKPQNQNERTANFTRFSESSQPPKVAAAVFKGPL